MSAKSNFRSPGTLCAEVYLALAIQLWALGKEDSHQPLAVRSCIGDPSNVSVQLDTLTYSTGSLKTQVGNCLRTNVTVLRTSSLIFSFTYCAWGRCSTLTSSAQQPPNWPRMP